MEGKRNPTIEKRMLECFRASTGDVHLTFPERAKLLESAIEPALQRELQHRGIASVEKSYTSKLLAWVEVE